jgi:hypothetical protein
MEYYILNYVKGVVGESGESCKNIYSFDNACEVCGTGAKLVGKLRTKGLLKTEKFLFETLDGDFIISQRLYEVLIKEGIKLGELQNVVNYKNNDLPFYHLNTDFYFPSATEKEGLITENQCQTCKRNGYFNKAIIGNIKLNIPTRVFPVGLYYSRVNSDFLGLSDLFFTWECIGLSNRVAHGDYVIRYARPLLIVSEHFKTALVSCKIKGLEFEQIIIASDATHLI